MYIILWCTYCHWFLLHCKKKKGRFNPARVISVASSLPNNVHTSRSNTSLTSIIIGLQFQTEE